MGWTIAARCPPFKRSDPREGVPGRWTRSARWETICVHGPAYRARGGRPHAIAPSGWRIGIASHGRRSAPVPSPPPIIGGSPSCTARSCRAARVSSRWGAGWAICSPPSSRPAGPASISRARWSARRRPTSEPALPPGRRPRPRPCAVPSTSSSSPTCQRPLGRAERASQAVRRLSTPRTRVILNFYSRLWEPPLRRGAAAGAGAPDARAELADGRRRRQPAATSPTSKSCARWQEVLLAAAARRCVARPRQPLPREARGRFRHLALSNFIVARPQPRATAAPSEPACRWSSRPATRPATSAAHLRPHAGDGRRHRAHLRRGPLAATTPRRRSSARSAAHPERRSDGSSSRPARARATPCASASRRRPATC